MIVGDDTSSCRFRRSHSSLCCSYGTGELTARILPSLALLISLVAIASLFLFSHKTQTCSRPAILYLALSSRTSAHWDTLLKDNTKHNDSMHSPHPMKQAVAPQRGATPCFMLLHRAQSGTLTCCHFTCLAAAIFALS